MWNWHPLTTIWHPLEGPGRHNMLYIHYVRYTCIMGAHCELQVTKNGNICLPTIGWGGTAAMRQKSADTYTTGQNNLLHLHTSYLRLFQCAPGVSRSKIQPNPYWCGSSDPLQTWIAITVMHVKKFNYIFNQTYISKKREIQLYQATGRLKHGTDYWRKAIVIHVK